MAPSLAAPGPGTIVFAHGNSFPGDTYRPLFDVWRGAGWRVAALPRFGHGEGWGVTSNWPRLREQLTAFIQAQGPGPVSLVGHSLGGVVSLMVACRHPALADALVMLDSPVVTGWRAHSVHVAKRTGLMPRISPGAVARKRRHVWPDRAAVRAHFASKPMFARWDPRVLDAYLEAGFEDRDGEVHLAFDRDIEARIYETLPHHLGALLRRHPPRCPVGFIAGTTSVEMRQGGTAGARRLAGPCYQMIEGGHLYPMERPDETAARVLALLADLRAPGAAAPSV